MASRSPFNLERVLRSQWGQAGFVFLIVLIVSLAMSVPRFEIAELRGGEVSRPEILLREVIRWGAWGLLSWPIVGSARWILNKSGSWGLMLVTSTMLSLICAWGALHLDYSFRELGVPAARQGEERLDRERRPPLGDRGFRPDRRAEDRFGEAGRRRGGRPNNESPSWQSIFWRHRWMSSILVYWVVLAMGAGLHSFLGMRDKERRAAELELRAERLRGELAQSQLGSLRDQLNPHFLFNALHSVGGLVRAKQEQVALKTLAAIGDLLRATLDHGGSEEATLRSELAIAERYLDIERIRLADRLQTDFEIDASLLGAKLPSLLLLPLVENAVKHGVANLPDGGCIRLAASREGEFLVLEVSDDGDGFPPDVLQRGGADQSKDRRSIGLENTARRLQALYGGEQRFELSNQPHGGASVRLTLPYHEVSREFNASAGPGELA